MKTLIIRAIIVVFVAFAAMLPGAVAFAGWEDSDNGCPPATQRAEANIIANAPVKVWEDILAPNNPPAAPQAWAITNPGNKANIR